MKVGTFKQKAHPILVFFVFSCIIVTIGLLYIMQKAEAKGDTLNSLAQNSDYLE